MPRSTSILSYRTLVAVVFAAIAVTVVACSGSGTIPSSSPATLSNRQHAHGGSKTQYTFSFQTVDHTQGGSDSRITGIDQRSAEIVGLNGTSTDNYSSWTAQTPYPSSTGYRAFRSKNYPYAGSTYMAAIYNGFYQSGTVFSPPPSQYLDCTACGVVFYSKGQGTGYNNPNCGSVPCQWTFIQDPNEGSGNCAATEVLGMAYYNLLVGFYKTGASSCGTQAFEEYYDGSGEYFGDFSVPHADSDSTRATGMNEEGNVVGTAKFNGNDEGWYYQEATYCTGLMAPQAKATYPLAVNWENEVVGYYLDAKQQTHGFLLLNPAAPPANQVWQTIDEPDASNYTVVSDINTHRYLTGWYQDAYGHNHGFVATCTNCNLKDSSRRVRDATERPATKRQNCTVGNLVWRRR